MIKMIKLIVDDYCQNCPEFEATMETQSYKDFYGELVVYHNVKCRYDERCKHIKDYLDNQKDGKNEDV